MQNSRGFTLIELLIVIAIIGVLSSILLGNLRRSTEKAKISNAKVELKQLISAIYLLESDTGRVPNGCLLNAVDSAETYLNSPWAGIITAPQIGFDTSFSPTSGNCGWTAQSIAAWNGPYARDVIDAWGNPYVFDPDYFYGTAAQGPAIISLGANGVVNTESLSDVVQFFSFTNP